MFLALAARPICLALRLAKLLDAPSDLDYGNVKRISDRHHGGPRRVGMTALDPRQVRDRDPGPLGDGFLRHACLGSQLANGGAERRLRIA